MGTPVYMAPEQLAGGAADARSDVYAFCVALYEALSGDRPFAGTTLMEQRAEKQAGAVRPPRGDRKMPARVRRVLMQGLRARPEERVRRVDGGGAPPGAGEGGGVAGEGGEVGGGG